MTGGGCSTPPTVQVVTGQCFTAPVLGVTTTGTGGIAASPTINTAGTCNIMPPQNATGTAWTIGGALTAGSGAGFNFTAVNNASLAEATSPIRTAGVAVARGGDAPSLTAFVAPTVPPGYTMFATGTPITPIGYSSTQILIQTDIGNNTQRVVFQRGLTLGNIICAFVGGSGSNFGTATNAPQNALVRVAGAINTNDQNCSTNGVTGAGTAGATLPTTPTASHFGTSVTTQQWMGTMSRAGYWSANRISNPGLTGLTQ